MPENLQIPMKKKDTTIACGVSPCCGTLTYKEGHGCYKRGDPWRFCGTRPEVLQNDDIYHTGSVGDSIHQDPDDGGCYDNHPAVKHATRLVDGMFPRCIWHFVEFIC